GESTTHYILSVALTASLHPRLLHSFPTRRSSDLLDVAEDVVAGVVVHAGQDLGEWITRLGFLGDLLRLEGVVRLGQYVVRRALGDRKSTRLNSSHLGTSYAVFCLKKIDAVPVGAL